MNISGADQQISEWRDRYQMMVEIVKKLHIEIGKERDQRAALEAALRGALAEWQNYFSAEGEFTGDEEPALNFYLEIEKIAAGQHLDPVALAQAAAQDRTIKPE